MSTEPSLRTSRKLASIAEVGANRDILHLPVPVGSAMRIVLVEWRIIPAYERVFLEYWSQCQLVPERSGLIGEFLSRVESTNHFPWINWKLDHRYTTFVNVGLWSDATAFQSQIGWKLDDKEPKLPFEYSRRRRIFLGPERWRLGGTALPISDHAQVS